MLFIFAYFNCITIEYAESALWTIGIFCYIIEKPPTGGIHMPKGGETSMMASLLDFMSSVLASIVAYFICKHMDR